MGSTGRPEWLANPSLAHDLEVDGFCFALLCRTAGFRHFYYCFGGGKELIVDLFGQGNRECIKDTTMEVYMLKKQSNISLIEGW